MSTIAFSRAQLLSSFMQAASFVSNKPTHPVLGGVLFDIAEGRLTLSASNETCGIQTKYEDPVDGPMLSCVIPPKLFINTLSQINDDVIHLSFDDEYQVSIKGGNKTSRLSILSSFDYPAFPSIEGKDSFSVEMEASQFQAGLRCLMPFVSDDPTKRILNGIYIGPEWYATDGHRMSQYKVDINLGLTIPLKTIVELRKHCTDGILSFQYEEHNPIFLVQHGASIYHSRVLDGQYPNCAQLIPQRFAMRATINREELIKELEYIMIIASQKSNIVTLDFHPSVLKLEATVAEVGSTVVTMTVDADNPIGEISVNGKYILDALKTSKSKSVVFSCNTKTSPAVITFEGEPDFLHLIMPIQKRD